MERLGDVAMRLSRTICNTLGNPEPGSRSTNEMLDKNEPQAREKRDEWLDQINHLIQQHNIWIDQINTRNDDDESVEPNLWAARMFLTNIDCCGNSWRGRAQINVHKYVSAAASLSNYQKRYP